MTENKKLIYNKNHIYVDVNNLSTLPKIIENIEFRKIGEFPKIHTSAKEIKILYKLVFAIFTENINNMLSRRLRDYLKQDMELYNNIQNNKTTINTLL